MNIKNILNEKEINLLEKAGVYVEDRDYNKQELEKCAFNIQDYIMLKVNIFFKNQYNRNF